MKCPAVFLAALRRLLRSGARVTGPSLPPKSAGGCGIAQSTPPRHSPDVMRQAVKSRSRHLRGEGDRRVRIKLHDRLIREVYSDAL